jgi:hypothetical protein
MPACGPGSSPTSADPLRTIGDSVNGQAVTSSTIPSPQDGESTVIRVAVEVVDRREGEETFRELASKLDSRSASDGLEALPDTEPEACDKADDLDERVGFLATYDRLDRLTLYAVLCSD